MTEKASKVQPVCTRQHIDMPAGQTIVRCMHGKIGKVDYSVCELFNRLHPNHGVFTYSAIPSPSPYSMVLMCQYEKATQQLRDSIFNGYCNQLRYGQLPIPYIMYCKQDDISKVDHSEESVEALANYIEETGIPPLPIPNGALLFGRICKDVWSN